MKLNVGCGRRQFHHVEAIALPIRTTGKADGLGRWAPIQASVARISDQAYRRRHVENEVGIGQLWIVADSSGFGREADAVFLGRIDRGSGNTRTSPGRPVAEIRRARFPACRTSSSTATAAFWPMTVQSVVPCSNPPLVSRLGPVAFHVAARQMLSPANVTIAIRSVRAVFIVIPNNPLSHAKAEITTVDMKFLRSVEQQQPQQSDERLCWSHIVGPPASRAKRRGEVSAGRHTNGVSYPKPAGNTSKCKTWDAATDYPVFPTWTLLGCASSDDFPDVSQELPRLPVNPLKFPLTARSS